MPHQCTECDHVFPDGSKAMLSGCPDCGGNTFQFLPGDAITADDPKAATPPTEDAPAEDVPAEEVPIDAVEPASDPGSRSGSESETDLDAGPFADSTDRSREPPPSRGPIGRATAAVRGWVRVDSSPPARSPDDPARTDAVGDDGEDAADVDIEPEPPSEVEARTESANEGEGSEIDTGTDDGTGPEDGAQADARRDVIPPEDLPATSDRSEPTADGTADDPRPPSGAGDGRIAAEPTGPTDDRPDLDELRRELNEQFESIRIVAPGQYELNLMELYNREEYIIALREDGRYAIEAPETWLGRQADRD